MNFDVAVETPSILVAGSTFRIKASFAILQKALGIPTTPSMQVIILKSFLEATTHMKVTNELRDCSYRDYIWDHNEYLFGVDSPPSNDDVRERLDTIIQSTSLTPVPKMIALTPRGISTEGSSQTNEGKHEIYSMAQVPQIVPASSKFFAITTC
jgi:hypothetical protein